mmetsp:Transcript_19378/g.45452  ORF Transcript_19378/g.45452 Transcript_19378/m.45452 type:complete len:212 (-) Transcript_19378:433-1068(-)
MLGLLYCIHGCSDIAGVGLHWKVHQVISERVVDHVRDVQEPLIDHADDYDHEHLLCALHVIALVQGNREDNATRDRYHKVLHVHEPCEQMHISKGELRVEVSVNGLDALSCLQALRLQNSEARALVLEAIAADAQDPRPDSQRALVGRQRRQGLDLFVCQQVLMQQRVKSVLVPRSLGHQFNGGQTKLGDLLVPRVPLRIRQSTGHHHGNI